MFLQHHTSKMKYIYHTNNEKKSETRKNVFSETKFIHIYINVKVFSSKGDSIASSHFSLFLLFFLFSTLLQIITRLYSSLSPYKRRGTKISAVRVANSGPWFMNCKAIDIILVDEEKWRNEEDNQISSTRRKRTISKKSEIPGKISKTNGNSQAIEIF